MNMQCPHCNIDLDIDDSYAGQEVECPACHNGFVVPMPRKSAAPVRVAIPSNKRLNAHATDSAGEKDAPGLHVIHCPKCNAGLDLLDSDIDKPLQCYCGYRFSVDGNLAIVLNKPRMPRILKVSTLWLIILYAFCAIGGLSDGAPAFHVFIMAVFAAIICPGVLRGYRIVRNLGALLTLLFFLQGLMALPIYVTLVEFLLLGLPVCMWYVHSSNDWFKKMHEYRFARKPQKIFQKKVTPDLPAGQALRRFIRFYANTVDDIMIVLDMPLTETLKRACCK